MEQAAISSGHNGTSFIHMASRLLERAGYYGIRGLLVLYLVGETFAMENTQALSIYGWFTFSLLAFEILGGLLGDLVIGNRITSVLGGGVQALGAFVLCIPSEATLYLGIGLIGLGAGLYGPNFLSLFGKNYYNKESHMDSGFTFLYLAINIGALIGAVIVGYLGSIQTSYGFILAGGFLILAMILMLLSSDIKIDATVLKARNLDFSKGVLWVLSASVLSAFFWALYDLGGADMNMISYDLKDQFVNSTLLNELWYSFNSVFTLLFAIILGVFWMFLRVNRITKIGIGFLFAAVGYGLFLLANPGGGGAIFGVFIFAMLWLGLAEVLVAPSVLSLITKYSNPKYLAIVMSVVYIPGRLLFKGMTFLTPLILEFNKAGLKIGLGLYLLFGVVIIVISLVTKNRNGNSKELA